MKIAKDNILISLFRQIFLLFIAAWVGVFSTVKAQQIIEVGGVLNEDTEWTSAFTYIVTEDVIVGTGIQLNIQPGVIVKFNMGRGLVIEAGKLFITGTESDSVRLLPNHSGNETWNWKGVAISSITEPDQILIEFAYIADALIGIRGNAAHFLNIENNTIHDNRNIGISLFNCSFCIIENNVIADNFLGLEIFATDVINQSSGNLVMNNLFSNLTTNIIIHNSNQGICRENTIIENIIDGGIHGIWLYNAGHNNPGNALISRNIIINTGTGNDGYAVYVSADSTRLFNNILWNNTTPVSFRVLNHSVFSGNSVYSNKRAVELRPDVKNISLTNNTITGSKSDVLVLSEYSGFACMHNNMFANELSTDVFINNTQSDIIIAENYWGTMDEGIIDALIYDKNDNPALGELIYKPFSELPDTIAPISPPRNVIAKIVYDSLRITWNPNPETDLAGYHVYYGDFADYSFSVFAGTTTDTTYTLPADVSNNLIAITAFDTQAQTDQPQLSGNESPFSFAAYLPFAGFDVIICKWDTVFEIKQSTVPFEPASIAWSTSGDGYFNDPAVLRPLYYPGDSDKVNGAVTLFMVVSESGTNFSDSLQLYFTYPPSVYAGENGIVSPEQVFIPQDAWATDFEFISWSSSGDGFFNDTGALHPTYYPGAGDIEDESVRLVLSAYNPECGLVTDTLDLYIKRRFSVEGRVWAGNVILPQNPVIATRLGNVIRTPLLTLAFTNDQGAFRFESLFAGDYLFYAPHDTSANPEYFPAYHVNQTRWEQAYVHSLVGDIREIDIRLPSLISKLPPGNGMISGEFLLPDKEENTDLYCQPWFESSGADFCQEGLSNVTILLFGESRQRIYKHTLTDFNGDFRFEGLPFGNYVIEAEMAEHKMSASDVIVLSPSHPSVTGVILQKEPEKKIGIYVPQSHSSNKNMILYPNPADQVLTIEFGTDLSADRLGLTVFNMHGEAIIRQDILPGDSFIQVNISHLRSGIFVAVIDGIYFSKIMKFIKK